MNKTITTLCLAITFLFCSCKSDADKLQSALNGLNKLPFSTTKSDSVLGSMRSLSVVDFPIYSEKGEILSLSDVKKNKINKTVDCFSDNTGSIKAVVFRQLTTSELDNLTEVSEAINRQNQAAIDSLSTKFAPVFSAIDVNNELLDLAKLKGKVVVLNFWFIRCHGCVQEMPELNEIKAEFKDKNVEFIGLTFDKEAETKAFLQKTKFDYKIIANAQKIFDQFNITACPVSIVINEEGKIMFTGLGYEEKDKLSQIQLRKALNKVLDKDKP